MVLCEGSAVVQPGVRGWRTWAAADPPTAAALPSSADGAPRWHHGLTYTERIPGRLPGLPRPPEALRCHPWFNLLPDLGPGGPPVAVRRVSTRAHSDSSLAAVACVYATGGIAVSTGSPCGGEQVKWAPSLLDS
jgi:hypothetical protein